MLTASLFFRDLNHLCRHTNCRSVIRNVLGYASHGADNGVITNRLTLYERGISSEIDTAADGGFARDRGARVQVSKLTDHRVMPKGHIEIEQGKGSQSTVKCRDHPTGHKDALAHLAVIRNPR